MRRSLLPAILGFLATGCVSAESVSESDSIGNDGKADSSGESSDALRVPLCTETAISGIETPLYRAADGSATFYYLPTQFVLEDGMAAESWIETITISYFEGTDAARYEHHEMRMSFRLDPEEPADEILATLRAVDQNAQLLPIDLREIELDQLELALPDRSSPTAITSEVDEEDRRFRVRAELTHDNLQALAVFTKAHGLGIVTAHVAFDCEADGQIETRDAYPSASGLTLAYELEQIPFDHSAGDLATSADQVMIQWDALKWKFNDHAIYLAEREAMLSMIMASLLDFVPGESTYEEVHTIAADARTFAEEVKSELATRGMSAESVQSAFASLDARIEALQSYAGYVRMYSLAE